MTPFPKQTARAVAALVLAALAPAASHAQARASVAATSGTVTAVRAEAEAGRLMVPVMGIRREQLHDTYSEARSEGRTHHAIDIHAPRGTPVMAVVSGTIRKIHEGDRGGRSIYLLAQDGRTRYYYAHLDGYAEGLREGQHVEPGEVIGFVGDSGNASPGDCHLHFSVAVLDSASRWWEGENLNPYDLLKPAAR
jgi:peptidoglycan LD-endopeptidase LytH